MDTYDLFKYRREPNKKRLKRFIETFWILYRDRVMFFPNCQSRRDIKRVCARLKLEIRKLRKEIS